MKYLDSDMTGGMPIIELTERNLLSLLEKLTDPNSARTLVDPDWRIAVKAVPDEEHYTGRAAGLTYTNGEYK